MSVNHMCGSGGSRQREHALRGGASPEEILQVVLLTTVVSAQHPIDASRDILGEEHHADTGTAVLETVPELARGYKAYDDAVWESGPLSRKDKELIALAVCAAPTCLFEPGMRRHIRGALKAGATAPEIAAVLHLSGALAIHTCTIGVPAFDDVMNGKTVGST